VLAYGERRREAGARNNGFGCYHGIGEEGTRAEENGSHEKYSSAPEAGAVFAVQL